MPNALKKKSASNNLIKWKDRLARLAADVKKWAKDEGWPIASEKKTIAEEGLAPYSVTVLHLNTPEGRIDLEPVGVRVLGANGRVDLTAWPSLNRVRLVANGGAWVIYTDSNIRWPKDWNRATFVELARELAASK